MPAIARGLLTVPVCEVFADAPEAPGRYLRATVLLRGAFVRVYPDYAPRGVVLLAPQNNDGTLRTLLEASTALPLG